ncbi:MAG: hypothetical protein ABIG28_01730 [archaeon]
MKKILIILVLVMFYMVGAVALNCGNSCEMAGACIANNAALYDKSIKCENGVWKDIDTSAIVVLDENGNVIRRGSSSGSSGSGAEVVGRGDATVCCEETNSGLFCLDVFESDCKSNSRQFPTSCDSTAFCKLGYCSDPVEGTCLDGVPQKVCNDEDGSWFAEKPPQCELGCCILGDQASFVTLTRCKKLSGFYGLETNFDSGITSEPACILIASASEKGACIFEEDFEKTCKMATRAECSGDSSSSSGENVGVSASDLGLGEAVSDSEEEAPLISPESCVDAGDGKEFCPGMLCSAESLGTNCGKTENTICVSGSEEVYFADTCGNPANIYDSSKKNNEEYWSYIKDKSESCIPNNANINSQSCGNCNYLLGSYCREAENVRATLGNNICASLNCPASDENTGGIARKHGESWCGYDDERDFVPKETTEIGEEASRAVNMIVGRTNSRVSSVLSQALEKVGAGSGVGNIFLGSAGGDVGSRFYRYSCINGEVTVEPCADFRQEECIENVIDTSFGEFREAACRVNRWQDCTAQTNAKDCVNSDVRDCEWLDGIAFVLMGSVQTEGSDVETGSLPAAKQILGEIGEGEREIGACVPENPPGLRYWEGEEAGSICAQANAFCPVKYEKGIGGDWECVENCECLPGGSLELQRIQLCMSLGDCGPKTNYLGVKGRGMSYKTVIQETKDD